MLLTDEQAVILRATPGPREPMAERAWTIGERAGVGANLAAAQLRILKRGGLVQTHGAGRDEFWSRTRDGDQAVREAGRG